MKIPCEECLVLPMCKTKLNKYKRSSASTFDIKLTLRHILDCDIVIDYYIKYNYSQFTLSWYHILLPGLSLVFFYYELCDWYQKRKIRKTFGRKNDGYKYTL